MLGKVNVLCISTSFIPFIYSKLWEGLDVNAGMKSFVVPINVKIRFCSVWGLHLNKPSSECGPSAVTTH